MADITQVRRIVGREVSVGHAADPRGGGLVPALRVFYGDRGSVVVSEGDPSLKGYQGAVLPYADADAAALVDQERDRRVAAGIEYPAGSGRIIQTRPSDQDNISQQMLRAVALLALGTPEAWGTGRSWLDASNANPLPLPDPQAMIALGVAVGDRKEALIYRGYAIKARLRAGEAVDFLADAAWS